ncbi:MAG: hypothetical protein IKK46_03560 [Clostridia bacterium]|nr:hypothetical protein [Clostridia bacterium]MBR3809358.1 hypothetical protein [Clostridia bacterium]
MESLRAYIKDNFYLVAFYNIYFVFCVIWIFIKTTDFFAGEITTNNFKVMNAIPFLPIVGWYFLSEARKLILVFIDYKKHVLVTDNFKIQNVGYEICSEPRNGAYFKIRIFNDKREFWLYRRSQIYSEFVTNDEYEITYYKYSRCIHSVKRLTFNSLTDDDIATLNKSKRKKKSKKKVLKKPLNIEPYKIFISNYTDGFILDIFLILTIPFFVFLCKYLLPKTLPGIYEQLFIISIPIVIFFYIVIIRLAIKRIASYICYKKDDFGKTIVTIDTIPCTRKFLVTSKPNEFFLFAIDESGKRKRYKYYSNDILGLGDLNERSGFMGYGNFLDSKYEIEYYKFSGLIKSMKLLSNDEATQQNANN